MSAQSLVPVSECHLKICTQRLTFETLPKFDQSDVQTERQMTKRKHKNTKDKDQQYCVSYSCNVLLNFYDGDVICLVEVLLAPQSSAFRRGAYRDSHPILPSTQLQLLGIQACIYKTIQASQGQYVVVCGKVDHGRPRQSQVQPGTAGHSQVKPGTARYSQVEC